MADEDDEQDQQIEQQDSKLNINFIKKWLKFYKSHRQLQLNTPLPQNTTVSMDSQAFVFFVHRVDGLPRPSSNQTQLGLKIVANMLMAGEQKKQTSDQTKNKCFFGRTYESPTIPVEFLPDGTSYEHQPIHIYYHSKVSGQASPLLLILEFLVTELAQNGSVILRRQTLGWVELCATALTNGPQKLIIRKGSPRVLLNALVPPHENSQFAATIELLQSPRFQICQYLIPENVLLGYMDELPGVMQNYIQAVSSPQDESISIAPTFTVYLSQVHVYVPEQIEQEVYKQVQRYRSYKFRVSEEYRGDIQVTSKRLIVGYHNGWTVVNSRGLNNFVPLSDSKKVHSEFVEGKSMVLKELEYYGVIDVNNISLPIDHEMNFGVLLLQLEYEATFLVGNIGKQTMQIVLGWLPIYLGDKVGTDHETLEEELISGPGKTVTGKPLAVFSSNEMPIRINATLNLQGITDSDLRMLQQQQQKKNETNQLSQQPSLNANERFRQTQNNDTGDLKSQLKMREQEYMLQKLIEENERLKKGSQTIQEQPQRSRELEYLKAIDMLREDNRLALLSTSKQFEDLEQIIRTTQKTQPIATRQSPVKGPLEDTGNLLFDRSDRNRYKQMNDQSAYPMPQSTLRPISKADTAFLLQTGIPGLLDGDPEDSDLTAQELERRAMKSEMDDQRRDSIIIIQPLAMKVYLQDEDLIDLKQLGFRVPQRLYFTIHFFDLPQYQTPNLMLEYSNEEKSLLASLRNGTPLRILTFNDQNTHSIKFTVDTGTVRYNNLHGDFIQYLYRRCLLIDVWDADSRLLFGSMKVPLRGLLRQGKSSQHLLKEVDILDTNFKRIKGSVQLLIRNIGRQSSLANPELAQKDARILSSTTQLVEKSMTISKRKIISEIKTIPNQPIEESVVQNETSQEDRINQRIRALKIKNLGSVHDSKVPHSRKLTEVQRSKEIKKPQIVKQIISDLLSSHKVLNTFFGRAEIVPYQFTNTYSQSFNFQILIEDPDSKYIGGDEFQVVIHPSEWKFWCDVKELPQPYSFDMIKQRDSEGKRQYYYFLEAGESFTVLFKFLSFRQIDAELQFDLDAADTAQMRGNEYIKKYIYPRKIQAYFSRIEGNNMMDGFSILIEPHMQTVDHVLRYYERDNRQTKLILPPLYSFIQPPDKRPIVYVNDPRVILEWGKDNKEIKLCLRVGEVCSVSRFNVLAYADNYAAEVVGNWQVEVHSLSGVDIEVPLGQNVASKLTLPCDVTRVVKLFCTHHGEVSFPEPYKNEFTLIPGRLNMVEYNVRTTQETPIRAQINCVDYHSHDLIYSWFLKINTSPQLPSATYEIKCLEGRESKQLLNYVNSTNFLTTFIFTCSQKQYLKIIDEQLQIGPMDRGEIRIRMLPKSGISQAETKIFITDKDERIFDTIVIKIRYVNS